MKGTLIEISIGAVKMDNDYKAYELYMKNRPHVVVLGAGASCAAIPNGDKYGKKISAMSGFIDKLGLSNIISRVKINTSSDNLEDIYMELDERSKDEQDCKEVKEELERIIWEYMSNYQCPIPDLVDTPNTCYTK